MDATAAIQLVRDTAEVGDVLGGHDAVLLLCECEESNVAQAAKLGPCGHRVDVMAVSTEPLGDDVRIHLIQQDLQAMASWAR